MEKKVIDTVSGVWEYPEGNKNSLWVECSECATCVGVYEAGSVCPSCKATMFPIVKTE